MKKKVYEVYCTRFFIFILFLLCLSTFLQLKFSSDTNLTESISRDDHVHKKRKFFDFSSEPVHLQVDRLRVSITDTLCTHWNCINSYKCLEGRHGLISVYIYDMKKFYIHNSTNSILPAPSTEFLQILAAIAESPYFVSDPEKACLFVPSVDLLNREKFDGSRVGEVLASLPYWSDGTNHLLFNMLPGIAPDYHTNLDIPHGKAIVAGGGFSQRSYRRSFDVSIPLFNPTQRDEDFVSTASARPLLFVSTQTGMLKTVYDTLYMTTRMRSDVVVLRKCNNQRGNYSFRCDEADSVHQYPLILTRSKFCLVTRSERLATTTLHDVMRAGCVPVIAMDSYVMPFSEVLDWKRAAVFIHEHRLDQAVEILDQVVADHNAYSQMQSQVIFFHQRYFSSVTNIALTSLRIINDRVLQHKAKLYDFWNRPAVPALPPNPFFVPLQPSQKQGFTAVVLTYDRVELMLQVVTILAKVRGAAKIIVIWNHQTLEPSPNLAWPSTNIPIKLIRTKHNHLSNRFYSYDEIETDCVLSVDDDITMVTPEELEFGYRVWSEYPDRLVGFPPRVHSLNGSEWRYESEWLSNISMVLTGLAFYHKYYNFLYTTSLPPGVKSWIDDHLNCEDIAMNFLISNYTGKAAIKVLARKKFKAGSNILSNSIQNHLVARNVCMKMFVDAFGRMPLKAVEFRADPVLFKEDSVMDNLKMYRSDGAL